MDKFYTLDNVGPECFSGWNDLIQPVLDYINEYNSEFSEDDENRIHITQVKEKFGVLEIYVDKSDDMLDNLIRTARKNSATVCEICGEEGKTMSVKGWLQTRCPKHAKK